MCGARGSFGLGLPPPSTSRQQQYSSRASEDTLLPGRRSSESTLVNEDIMAGVPGMVDIERKRSFGIGGAGNIRSSFFFSPRQ